jgi:N-(2-amino-2-carboxyethyl)-L-glutamate synthase
MTPLEVLDGIVNFSSPIVEHPSDRRLLLKFEGGGLNYGHKFRSAAYLVKEKSNGQHVNAVDRSSGSWAMALAYACNVTGGSTQLVSVGEPPSFVRSFVEQNNGSFKIVGSNRERILEVEKIATTGVWFPDQHNNPTLIDAFHATLGNQIRLQLDQCSWNPKFVVAPVGTGALLAGVVRALRSPQKLGGNSRYRVTSIGVDLSSSINHEGSRSWKLPWPSVRGVGSDDEVCGTLRASKIHIDEMLPCDGFQAAREMQAINEIFPKGCGLSGGLAVSIAKRLVLPRCGKRDSVLVLLPDTCALYAEQLDFAHKLFAGLGKSQ